MHRFILVMALALSMSVLAFQTTPAAAQAPTIDVTPGSGSQFDVFTFVGRGFAPGTELTEAYYSPDGEFFTYYFGADPAVIVVGDDGTFILEVRPNVDFQGARAGRWTVSFCIAATNDCWSGFIDISV